MIPAEAWLRARAGRAPEGLLSTMITALDVSSDDARDDVPEALARAALRLYTAAVKGKGERADALPLLAADALFTHAFEAQAELDPAGVSGLAERYGARGHLYEVAL